MTDTIDETEILERLNRTTSARAFFIATAEIIEDEINVLTQRIFRNDYLAVQSVVAPLLDSSGPLGELSVRLKLLLGLGVVQSQIYQDIDCLLKIKQRLINDGEDYQFSDQVVLEPIQTLSTMPPLLERPNFSEVDSPELQQLQNERTEQILRSGLSLAILKICHQLDINSPFIQ